MLFIYNYISHSHSYPTPCLPLLLLRLLLQRLNIQEPTRRRNHKLATRPIINKQKRHLERIFVEDTESNEYFGNNKHEERQRHRHLQTSMPDTNSATTVSSNCDAGVGSTL